MKTVKAIWLKFHPGSACSVGQVEEIPEDRFKELSENQFVAEYQEPKAEKREAKKPEEEKK